MWIEQQQRSLADWIRDLVDGCDVDPQRAGERLRAVVGGRRARIALDKEVVEVELHGSALEVGPPSSAVPVDGTGSATSDVVIALLDGELEVSAALHDGLITATGHRDAITRMFHAIEIVLDASTRVPAMRRLADEFRAQVGPRREPEDRRNDAREAERALLDRLGLLGRR